MLKFMLRFDESDSRGRQHKFCCSTFTHTNVISRFKSIVARVFLWYPHWCWCQKSCSPMLFLVWSGKVKENQKLSKRGLPPKRRVVFPFPSAPRVPSCSIHRLRKKLSILYKKKLEHCEALKCPSNGTIFIPVANAFYCSLSIVQKRSKSVGRKVLIFA